MFYIVAAVAVLGDAVVNSEPVNWPAVVVIIAGALIQRYFDYRTERDRREREEQAEQRRAEHAAELAKKVKDEAAKVAGKLDEAATILNEKIDENTQISREAFTAANNFNLKLLLAKKEWAEEKAREEQKRLAQIDATTKDTNVTLHAAVDTPKE